MFEEMRIFSFIVHFVFLENDHKHMNIIDAMVDLLPHVVCF
jgi:hypothetical protein